MAELFQTSPQNITLHLKALYSEGEIVSEATCKSYLQVRSEGERQIRRTVKSGLRTDETGLNLNRRHSFFCIALMGPPS